MIVDASLKLEAAPTVVTREVGGEMMLVDLESGTYFGLNDVGGRLWQLLDDGEPLGRACEQLLEEFDVDSGQLHSDVGTLIDELLARKLLVTAA